MTEPVLLYETDARGVATVTFNRPQVNNAYNGAMLDALTAAVRRLADDAAVRLVVLRGNGRHFQAGADLKYLAEISCSPPDANLDVSRRTTGAVRALNEVLKPTMALVHGGCFGGGTGIVAACDMVVASEDAVFSIAEARWGMQAGPIFPQLIAAMGEHNARRYALTCERFDAERARDTGLVDVVCPTGELDAAAVPLIDAILQGGPDSLRETKRLIRDVAQLAMPDELFERLSAAHAEKRQSAEAEEGLRSFAEKRNPNWYPG